jgi:hypothetical protein
MNYHRVAFERGRHILNAAQQGIPVESVTKVCGRLPQGSAMQRFGKKNARSAPNVG